MALDTYTSEFGTTVSGNIRGGNIKDTYEASLYLDSNNSIVGIQSKNINNGEIFGEASEKFTNKLGVGNIVKHIIESSNTEDKVGEYGISNNVQYNNVSELLKELTIAYSYQLNKITQSNEKINDKNKNEAA